MYTAANSPWLGLPLSFDDTPMAIDDGIFDLLLGVTSHEENQHRRTVVEEVTHKCRICGKLCEKNCKSLMNKFKEGPYYSCTALVGESNCPEFFC